MVLRIINAPFLGICATQRKWLDFSVLPRLFSVNRNHHGISPQEVLSRINAKSNAVTWETLRKCLHLFKIYFFFKSCRGIHLVWFAIIVCSWIHCLLYIDHDLEQSGAQYVIWLNLMLKAVNSVVCALWRRISHYFIGFYLIVHVLFHDLHKIELSRAWSNNFSQRQKWEGSTRMTEWVNR